MKRVVTAAAAVAVSAAIMAGSTTSADAYWRRGWGWGPGIAAGLLGGAIIGGAIASSRYYAPPPPGYAYYPAYAEPVAGPNCYWARVPVYDAYGHVMAWRGAPRMVCP